MFDAQIVILCIELTDEDGVPLRMAINATGFHIFAVSLKFRQCTVNYIAIHLYVSDHSLNTHTYSRAATDR